MRLYKNDSSYVKPSLAIASFEILKFKLLFCKKQVKMHLV